MSHQKKSPYQRNSLLQYQQSESEDDHDNNPNISIEIDHNKKPA